MSKSNISSGFVNLEQLLNVKAKNDITYSDLLSCEEWFHKRDKIKNRDLQKCTVCNSQKSIGPFFTNSSKLYVNKLDDIEFSKQKKHLEVHHKLYIINRMPWQYEDEDLTTVCNDCHKSIHEREEIFIYDETRTVKIQSENCDRCNGIGFLKEYKHIENGICFKCRGVGKIIPIFT